MKRWAIGILIPLAVVMTGCGNSSGGDDVSTDVTQSASAPPKASAAQAVEAYVYATAAELAQGQAFIGLEIYLRQSLMNKCMKKSGFTFPVQATGATGLFNNNLFPDIERMERTGQLVPGGPQASIRDAAAGKADPPPVPENQRAAYDKNLQTCSAEADKNFLALDSAGHALQTQWFTEVNRIKASAEVGAARARYSSCMEKEGVPQQDAGNFAAFMAWQTGEMTRTKDDQALIDTDHKWAVVFVRCAKSLVHMQDGLQKEAKQKFLQEHFQEVKALQETADATVAAAQKQLGATTG